MASVATLQTAERPRAYVSVKGPDAASYLNRMVSNEVEDMPIGEAREALLLTAKARIVAPLVVWRRGAEDYLLLTEPEAGDRLVDELRALPLRGEVRHRARGASLARPPRARTSSL